MTTTTCGKCGSIVRLDHPACPACGEVRSGTAVRAAATVSAAAPVAPRREDVETEVGARLMWGDPPEVIRADFVRKGVRPGEIDVIVRKAVEARKAAYRMAGIKDVLIGAGLLALGLFLLLFSGSFLRGETEERKLPIWVLIVGITAPISGILMMVKGGRRIARPGVGERETEAGVVEDDD
jgi:hypothetical protein